MKIIRDPEVYLVGTQTVVDEEIDRFLENHGITWSTDTTVAGEELIETAGRLCYMSFAKPRPGGNAAYIDHIKQVGHGSVVEHATYNFIITGVSRSFSHELVRHRAGWGYSQLSQRYVDESVAEYVEPDVIAADPEMHSIWLKTVEQAQEGYKALVLKLSNKLFAEAYTTATGKECKLLDDHYQAAEWLKSQPAEKRTELRKSARQAARSVLPNATETKVFVTVNARALRHFIEMRASRFAEPEIRKVAVKMLQIVQEESPNIFGDYQLNPLPDGTYEAETKYRKI